jgi:hypothetical protein
MIIVGDKSTPESWRHIPGIMFLSLTDQHNSEFTLFSKALPERHYARKNLGYLLAAKETSDFIYETDDDNYPIINPLYPSWNVSSKVVVNVEPTWINVYSQFEPKLDDKEIQIWPRGLPLTCITTKKGEQKEQMSTKQVSRVNLIQGLAEGNPDVDAIFRMVNNNPSTIKFKENHDYVLPINAISPTNSQTTWWSRSIFPLLYLPATCTFRVTDILRGIVALRFLHSREETVKYTSPRVFQERNEHDLIKDFVDELPIILNIEDFTRQLYSTIVPSSMYLYLREAYNLAAGKGLVTQEEFSILESWIFECNRIDGI